MSKKSKYIIVVILICIIAVLVLRFFLREDTWICRDKQWIRHGNPSEPMPTKECHRQTIQTLFIHYLKGAGWLVYIFIFLGMFFEGDAILFAAFYLARSGYFDVGLLLAISIVGVVIGDLIWYKIGEHLEKRSAFFRKIANKITGPIDKRLQKKTLSTIFITKFTYGIHHGVLLRAGAIKIPFKKYFGIVSLAGTVWIFVIGLFAYFSSFSLDLLKKYVKYGEVGLLIGIIIFFVLMHLLSKIGKEEIEEDAGKNSDNK